MANAPAPRFRSCGKELHPTRATIEYNPTTASYIVTITRTGPTGRLKTDGITYDEGEMDHALNWLQASFRRATRPTLF